MTLSCTTPVLSLLSVPLLVSLVGCGSGTNSGFPGEVGTYDPDSGVSLSLGDATAQNALDAYIEQGDVQVRFITLSCSGDCADVEAVATGGHPPYTYAWNDGPTSATRQVCPTSSTSYSVKVTDTGMNGEFSRAPETAKASLTADVLACPDGGVADAAPPGDAGCSSAAPPGAAPTSCTPQTGGQIDSLPMAPLVADVPTAFQVTGTGSFIGGQGWHWEVWGSPDGCTLDELLGTFQLVNGPYDFEICVVPTHSNPYAVLFYRFAATDGASLSTFDVAQCGGCANTSDN